MPPLSDETRMSVVSHRPDALRFVVMLFIPRSTTCNIEPKVWSQNVDVVGVCSHWGGSTYGACTPAQRTTVRPKEGDNDITLPRGVWRRTLVHKMNPKAIPHSMVLENLEHSRCVVVGAVKHFIDDRRRSWGFAHPKVLRRSHAEMVALLRQ